MTLPYNTPDSTYSIESVSITANAFSIRAVPLGIQNTYDTMCKNFTLNQLGQQGVTGTSSASPTGCWGGRQK